MSETTSFISKVGFEIEGGWDGEKGVCPFDDIQLISDHSINGQTLKSNPIQATHVGEAVSPPIVYAPGWTGLQEEEVEWFNWLQSHWPNAEPPNRTNHTCGFHIHLSFHSHKAYTLLTSKVFLYELRQVMLAQGSKEKLPRSHPFWERANGANTFCHLDFNAPKQMEIASKGDGIRKARYGWLNFASLLHGTMEFRALPTFRDFPIAARFSHAYFTFVDSYLAANIGTELVLERIF